MIKTIKKWTLNRFIINIKNLDKKEEDEEPEIPVLDFIIVIIWSYILSHK